MLIQETLNNGLIKTYSNENKFIIQNETGIKYAEAVDVPNKFTYVESSEEIPNIENIE